MFGFNLRGGNKRGSVSGFGLNTVFHKPSQQAADNTKDAEEKAKIEKKKAAKKAAEEEAARVAAEEAAKKAAEEEAARVAAEEAAKKAAEEEAASAEEVEEELEQVD